MLVHIIICVLYFHEAGDHFHLCLSQFQNTQPINHPSIFSKEQYQALSLKELLKFTGINRHTLELHFSFTIYTAMNPSKSQERQTICEGLQPPLILYLIKKRRMCITLLPV